MKDKEEVRDFIRKNYTEVALTGSESGCCGGGCSCGTPINIKETAIKLGYTESDLANVPLGANMGLGCGNPVAISSLKPGEVVLDLGSGGGFDCFLAREQVGETGYVIGVDMTPDMIQLARRNLAESSLTNMDFRLGEIEHLPVADASVDVIISNCVINLALDKAQVFREAYRVLKPGGRLSISDVVATAPLPQKIKEDMALIASCIGGASYVEDVKAMLTEAGFTNICLTPKDNSREIIKSWAPDKNIEDFIASFIIEAIR